MSVVLPVAFFVAENHRDDLIRAVKQCFFRRLRKIFKWLREVPTVITSSKKLSLLYHIFHAFPRNKSALANWKIRIDRQVFRKMQMNPKSGTVRTSTVRIVERKQPRFNLRKAYLTIRTNILFCEL